MRVFWAACAAVAFVVACGDSSSGIGTGLPAATPLSDLTDVEVRTLCEDFTAVANGAFGSVTDAQICTFLALEVTMDEPSCQNLAALCVDGDEVPSNPFPSIDPMESCMDAQAADLEGCEGVTTGELEACLNDVLDGVTTALGSLDCSLAGDDAALFAALLDGFASEACDAVPATCLELFESPMTGMEDAR